MGRFIPSNLPEIKVLFTNADQLTPSKMSELKNYILREKPLIIGVCEVKPKNGKSFSQLDYEIPDYILYPTNLDIDNPGSGSDRSIYSQIDRKISHRDNTNDLIRRVMPTADQIARR